MGSILSQEFFDQEPLALARSLLGKVIRHRIHGVGPENHTVWLSARVTETEAYCLSEKGSHSSLGLTEKRRAVFMPPGTIYMYYARGKDSLNFSARGSGDCVLIKSGFPHFDKLSPEENLEIMQQLNPSPKGPRAEERLCAGQTLLCASLGLKVVDWNQKTPEKERLRVEDVGYKPDSYIQCARLGIPKGRDEHLPYRFIDYAWAGCATSNPLTKRAWKEGKDYVIRSMP